MDKRLIIISDLWGCEKSSWLVHYTQVLQDKFCIDFYDSCELGGVDKSDYNQKSLHNQFVNGGIERAVDTLAQLETHAVNVLAFSVGGIIAWKYGLRTGNIQSLICISSTRLRKETKRPKGKIKLYFGAKDEFVPEWKWLDAMDLDYEILDNKKHQVYTEPDFASKITKQLIIAPS